MSFGTVAILGPGLIGGSLALALSERRLVEKLVIYARSERALEEIRRSGLVAEFTADPAVAVREADIVILCVPIEAMKEMAEKIVPALKPTALVTDVGSVKGSVERELAPLLEGRALWIGSHPMAGSEQGGFGAARADLFEGAAVIVAATKQTAPETEERASAFWRALGGVVHESDPDEHDLAVAEISHLPHLVAALLAAHARDKSLLLAAGGFRDTTRIASGSPELWTEILWANRHAMSSQCIAWTEAMSDLGKLFKQGDENSKSALSKILRDGQTKRSRLLKQKPAPAP